jgi:glycosyltransferase involved in cell wall biosynthesis
MIEFSVVIPTYNRSLLIAETLEAIRGQRYQAAEIIVVDDGSTDDTEGVVKRQFPEVKCIRISNVGTGAARAAAAEMATREWIAFCDDDDIWTPDHLERRAKLVERFPEALFTYSNFRAFGSSMVSDYIHFDHAPPEYWNSVISVQDEEFFLLKEDAFRYFLRFNSVYPFTTAIRRDFYRDVGGINPHYSRMQPDDSDFLLRCALKTRIAGDCRVTALYRRHNQQQTANKVANVINPARIAIDALTSGAVPVKYHAEVKEYIVNLYRAGYLAAFYGKDFEMMKITLGESAEIRKDPRLLARYVYAGISNHFGWNGFAARRPERKNS